MTIKKRAFNLEKEALLASGIREKGKVVVCSAKLHQIHQQFVSQMMPSSEPIDQARALFTWLWIEKPTRYKPQGPFRLGDVIEAQLSKEDQTVGNCLGLTLLYSCLLQRMGIDAESLYLENDFGIRPHVLSLIKTKELLIDVENILPDGFGYKGHLNNPSRTRWGDRELVADIHLSLGNEFFEKKEFIEALKNYETALILNPQYEKAHLNKAMLLDKMGEKEELKNRSSRCNQRSSGRHTNFGSGR